MAVAFKKRALLFLMVLISACDWGRTPSAIRFAENCGVELPSNVKVIRDEYEGMGSDYVIYYKVQLTKPEMAKFLLTMKRLTTFYSKTPTNENEGGSALLSTQYTAGAWYKTKSNYRFFKESKGTSYNAFVDTVRLRIDFQEFGG